MTDIKTLVIDPKKFSKCIKRSKMRPAEVARAAGMSRQNLHDYLKSRKNISADRILRLCLVLDIDIRELGSAPQKKFDIFVR